MRWLLLLIVLALAGCNECTETIHHRLDVERVFLNEPKIVTVMVEDESGVQTARLIRSLTVIEFVDDDEKRVEWSTCDDGSTHALFDVKVYCDLESIEPGERDLGKFGSEPLVEIGADG